MAGDVERVTEAAQASENETIEGAVDELFNNIKSRINSKDELRETYKGMSAVALDNAVEYSTTEQKIKEQNLKDGLVAKIKNWNQTVDTMQGSAMATIQKEV